MDPQTRDFRIVWLVAHRFSRSVQMPSGVMAFFSSAISESVRG